MYMQPLFMFLSTIHNFSPLVNFPSSCPTCIQIVFGTQVKGTWSTEIGTCCGVFVYRYFLLDVVERGEGEKLSALIFKSVLLDGAPHLCPPTEIDG